MTASIVQFVHCMAGSHGLSPWERAETHNVVLELCSSAEDASPVEEIEANKRSSKAPAGQGFPTKAEYDNRPLPRQLVVVSQIRAPI